MAEDVYSLKLLGIGVSKDLYLLILEEEVLKFMREGIAEGLYHLKKMLALLEQLE